MKSAFLSIILVFISICSRAQVKELHVGNTLEMKIFKDQNHEYVISLKRGEYAQFTIMQKGVDLAIDVITPKGEKLKTFDSPNGDEGPEEIVFDAIMPGKYKIKIYPFIEANVADTLLARLKEDNQGLYNIEKVAILSPVERQKILAAEKRNQQQFIDWITAVARPLNSVTAGSGFDDLQWLKPVLNNVDYVGLGEATHGTREIFQMKHRMLEFLVKEMGFTIFAIEAPYAGCKNINDYVLYGNGDARTALNSQGFWTWNTEEVIELIEWMRTYNTTVPDTKKVQFYGFDISVSSLGGGVSRLHNYLKKVDMITANANDTLMKNLYSLEGKFNGDSANQAKQKFSTLLNTLVLRRSHYILASSTKEYEDALQYATIIAQLQDAYIMEKTDIRVREREWRDYYMAANFHYLVQHNPDAKVVLWAHNSHINKNAEAYVNGGLKPIGSYLNDAYGSKYYPMAFAFSKGSFQALELNPKKNRVLREFTVPSAKEGMLDWYLAQSKKDKFIIDLRQKNIPEPVQQMLKKELGTRNYGAVASDTGLEYFRSVSLSKDFDAVIFINNTTRARPTQSVKTKFGIKE